MPDEGRLAGAALDVLRVEPPSPEDSLLHRDDVVIIPHAVFTARKPLQELRRKAVEQVMEALAGRTPLTKSTPRRSERLVRSPRHRRRTRRTRPTFSSI
jgi:phosphoglycerate dehydrogenase-like enzyme